MMRGSLGPIIALLLSVSILLAGQGLQLTLLPARAALESFPTLAIGIMGAVYFFGFTVGCLKGGELIKRVGHVRVFLAMAALASATPLLHGLIVHPIAWTVLRLVTGFCFAVLYVVIESWLNEQSTNETRGAVFAIYVMITLTVTAAGQMMNLLYDPLGLQLFIVASILVSIGAVPIALSTSPAPEPPASAEIDLRQLIRISPTGAAACLGSGLANGSFWALAPVFTAAITPDVSLAAWFMTGSVLGGAAAQWPLGALSDRVGRRGVLVVMCVVGTLISALAVFAVGEFGFVGVVAIGAAWGTIGFPLYSIAVAHANDFAEADEFVKVSAGLLLIYGIGAVIGPLVASACIDYFGAGGLFLFIAWVYGALALAAFLRMLRHRQPEEDHHVSFQDVLATVQTASVVYEEEVQQHAVTQEADEV